MFGIYRYLLAHMVVVAHLAYAVGMWSGAYAVFSFFALSGYLMTMVLDTTYAASRKGLERYVVNRALRIYPPYLLVTLLAIGVVLWDPYWAKQIGNMSMPRDPIEWLRNLGIFTLHLEPKTTARLVPPSWSVDIELCFYVAMGLGLARGRRIVMVWLLGSLAYTAWIVAIDLEFPLRYARLGAASLPYAMGAALWTHRETIGRLVGAWWHAPLSIVLYLANALDPKAIWGDAFMGGFYVSLALTAYVIAGLAVVDAARVPAWLRRADILLGNLSYPVFLCHFPVASVMAILGYSFTKGWELFWLSLPAVNIVALALHWASEQPLVALRDRVRGSRR
jgi:peptidoglycan/LPS O-acetylase OafA/YrhL